MAGIADIANFVIVYARVTAKPPDVCVDDKRVQPNSLKGGNYPRIWHRACSRKHEVVDPDLIEISFCCKFCRKRLVRICYDDGLLQCAYGYSLCLARLHIILYLYIRCLFQR